MVGVPKLKWCKNCGDWAFASENFFVLEGMSDFIGRKVAADKKTKDEKAKTKLIVTIDPSLYAHIKSAQTAKKLWEKLFDDSDSTRRLSLLRTLISIHLQNCEKLRNSGHLQAKMLSCQYHRSEYFWHSSKKERSSNPLKGFTINDQCGGSLLDCQKDSLL